MQLFDGALYSQHQLGSQAACYTEYQHQHQEQQQTHTQLSNQGLNVQSVEYSGQKPSYLSQLMAPNNGVVLNDERNAKQTLDGLQIGDNNGRMCQDDDCLNNTFGVMQSGHLSGEEINTLSRKQSPNCNYVVMQNIKQTMDNMPKVLGGDKKGVWRLAVSDDTEISMGKGGMTSVRSNSIMTTTSTMLTTTLITTTTITTSIVSVGLTQQSTTSTTSTTIDTEAGGNKDGKRKKTSDMNEESDVKKQIMESNEGEQQPISSNNLMERMYSEIIGIKTMVESVETKLKTVDDKVETIKEENKLWISRLTSVEKEVNEVKDSVEMAHNLINDETKNRIKDVSDIKGDLVDKTWEMSNTAKLIRNNSNEIKGLKDGVKQIDDKMSTLTRDQENKKSPIRRITSKMETGEPYEEFPVQRTIVAQHVWCTEGEDVDKIASTIVHKALELPHIRIVRTLRKSGKPGGSGLIKIKLNSKDEVHEVLKVKAKLWCCNVKELKSIFL